MSSDQQRQEARRESDAAAYSQQNDAEQKAADEKLKRSAEHAELRGIWNALPQHDKERIYDAAIAAANSEFQRLRLTRRRDMNNPPREVLAELGKAA